ncbi:uncharacterized protein [Chironomus tepperi]|uniref:uncharacterized protein n=1 Tax=Chironomus tepperi TaxID=113505 RepID=UPI00391FAEEA
MIAVNSSESAQMCCKVPPTGDPKIVEAVIKEHPEVNNNTFKLGHCLLAKYYMVKLNLTALKSEDIKNYVRVIFKEPEWIEAMDKVTDQCLESLPKYVKSFKKHYKITDEECDLRYETFLVCTIMYAYKECPTKDLINVDKCKSVKQFFDNCLFDGEAFIAYIDKHNI